LSVKLKDFSLFQNYKFSEQLLIQNDLEVFVYTLKCVTYCCWNYGFM